MKTQYAMEKAEKIKFPPFDLKRLLTTIFQPRKGERLCILIDLDRPEEVKNFAFLKKNHPIQKRAYELFYQELQNGVAKELGLQACDFFAYKKTGGSNLELPEKVISPEGVVHRLRDIYSQYDIILCIGNHSATAPLTAAAKKYGFRGATMHGVNEVILRSGLAVDYNEISKKTEKLRQAMTRADSADIDFEVDQKQYHLNISLGKQEAQKSHGICHSGPDVVNLPAGEVYYVPHSAVGSFPIKFEEDGTLAEMHVQKGKVFKVTLIRGNQATLDSWQRKLAADPSVGILGELGFGTQILPFANSDIQDEKIFGTFHLATGRNDHLNGKVTLDKFIDWHNATHDDILFSPTKTPEIDIKLVKLNWNGTSHTIIENNQPSQFLIDHL